MALGLTSVVIAAVLGGTQLDRTVSFSVPLAVIAFVLSGALVPALSGLKIATPSWAAPAVLVIAAVIGIGGACLGFWSLAAGWAFKWVWW